MKDFDGWNKIKKKVNISDRVSVREGEVYWCRLGTNVGVEQDGKGEDFQRPVLVLKKFSRKIILVAPLTTVPHVGSWYFPVRYFGRTQQVILNQVRPIDTRRLLKGMGEISRKELRRIKEAYIRLIL